MGVIKPKKSPKISKKILLPIVIVAVFITIAGFTARYFYNSYFTRPPEYPLTDQLNFRAENAVFDILNKKRYEFPSNNQQALVGYNYFKTDSPKALIVFSHGIGAGHGFYRPLINALADCDYWVFAFDATGTDESEGDSIVGLEQHVIDLEYALKFIQTQKEFDGLKISLVGHSWGGYAVSAVLNLHPDVTSVVSISGFSNPYDLEFDMLDGWVGWVGRLATPFLKLTQLQKFGKYEGLTGLDGFKSTNTPGLIVASKDDEVVLPQYGYQLYQSELPDLRLEYIILNKRGHATYWTDEALQKYTDFNKCYSGSCESQIEQAVWTQALDGIKAKYNLSDGDNIIEHLDAWQEVVNFLNSRFSIDIWQNAVDEKIVQQIDEFITKSMI